MTLTTLVKSLVAAGLGSRRTMVQAVKDGRVRVNGALAESFSQPVDTATDHLTLDGQPVGSFEISPVYIILNKPAGILSTTQDERARPTVISLLPVAYRDLGLHPVGRLDMDSRGLMLLTNDGDLTLRLTHPRFEKDKEYLVRLDRPMKSGDKRRFEQGVELADGLTSPLGIRDFPGETAAYLVTLHEGRKRQLRRMFHHLGYSVRDLARIRLGSLRLGNLAEGKSRLLTQSEINALQQY